jgi:hypothetical protein
MEFLPMRRIQVKWLLALEGQEEETEVWWDATVVGRTSHTHELQDDEEEDEEEDGEEDKREKEEPPIVLPVYEIRYVLCLI